ncbi:MAG: hypothetical protein JJ992_04780, partial [Planctomycetes bacterium]|nr:hypothetical protein [Planctomycetota bacterium]
LVGGVGGDELYGQVGNDFLWGGVDGDRLEGGDGNDTYVMEDVWGNDTITEALRPGDTNTLDFTRVTSNLRITINARPVAAGNQGPPQAAVASDENGSNNLALTNIDVIQGGKGRNEYVVSALWLGGKITLENAASSVDGTLDLSALNTNLNVYVFGDRWSKWNVRMRWAQPIASSPRDEAAGRSLT